MTNRRDAGAARRNRQPILDVLTRVMPSEGLILEVASGTGQHAAFFAPHLAPCRWQPTDIDSENFASISDWAEDATSEPAREGLILPPLRLDASDTVWPIARADAIICINMVHIAPIEACSGLLAGAARILPKDRPLFLYGPFKRHGTHTAPSNQAFDESLRGRDPRWGVRDLDALAEEASGHNLLLDEVVEMPANNLSVVFRNRPSV